MRRGLPAALLAMLSVGCAGLPPKPVPVQLPSAAPLDSLESGGAGEWPAPEWWKRYQDPTLDQLIELGGRLLADPGDRARSL